MLHLTYTQGLILELGGAFHIDQRVVLPRTTPNCVYILADVPQGSILGPIFFLSCIDDIVNAVGSNIRLFADNTRLFIVENPLAAEICFHLFLPFYVICNVMLCTIARFQSH